MELYKEILAGVLAHQEIQINFPNLQITPTEIVELKSYQALQKIKAVITDDSLSDSECLMKIEEIIILFDTVGCNGGTRHDFG